MTYELYKVIGIMSGTSLDGMDMALCNFNYSNDSWNFSIERAVTLPYSREWKERLQFAHALPARELLLLHKEYGRLIGVNVTEFIRSGNTIPDFIASHGHTIFHEPSVGLTFQLGDGIEIAITANLPVVSDFRSLDVALGGQGAPLVPVGDDLLFADYAACLNLGGFANISFRKGDKRIAYDICPVNIIINHLAGKYYNMEMDKDGEIARRGTTNEILLAILNNLEHYTLSSPKSLGREWLEKQMLPVIEGINDKPEIIIKTLYEHISIQLSDSFRYFNGSEVLITGGGAKNRFLLEILKDRTDKILITPDKNIIDYKEALIFAFLGVLRWNNEVNTLSSATGAKRDSSGGCVYLPPK